MVGRFRWEQKERKDEGKYKRVCEGGQIEKRTVGDAKEIRKTGSRALRDKGGATINDGCRQT